MTPTVAAAGERPARTAARVGVRALRIALLALVLGTACAPHRVAPPSPGAGAREAAFRASLSGRETRGRAVDAAVTLWARSQHAGVWPAVTGALTLRAPDALRLRVASMFGTAFDGAVRGDSVVAVLPTRGLGLIADAARDPLGLRRPGALGFRMFAAAWRPPDSAWASGTWSQDTLALHWLEQGDSLRLDIGPDGLPVAITLGRGDSLRVHAEYRAWKRIAGVSWPSWIELEGGGGALAVRCKVDRLRFVERPGPGRPMAQLPAGTTALDWPGFRRALERAPGLR